MTKTRNKFPSRLSTEQLVSSHSAITQLGSILHWSIISIDLKWCQVDSKDEIKFITDGRALHSMLLRLNSFNKWAVYFRSKFENVFCLPKFQWAFKTFRFPRCFMDFIELPTNSCDLLWIFQVVENCINAVELKSGHCPKCLHQATILV